MSVMSYETLAVESVGDELIVLVRRGGCFRVISAPRCKLRPVSAAVRRTFRVAEVAWRAFEFVVATERFWATASQPTLHRRLRTEVHGAGREFRAAALRHDDPPGIAHLVPPAGGSAP